MRFLTSGREEERKTLRKRIKNMKPFDPNSPIDYAAIELEARKMRAEAVRNGVTKLTRWAALPFQRVTRAI